MWKNLDILPAVNDGAFRARLWSKRQLEAFIQGVDFKEVQVNLNINSVALCDHAVTLEVAKHIALMSRTEKVDILPALKYGDSFRKTAMPCRKDDLNVTHINARSTSYSDSALPFGLPCGAVQIRRCRADGVLSVGRILLDKQSIYQNNIWVFGEIHSITNRTTLHPLPEGMGFGRNSGKKTVKARVEISTPCFVNGQVILGWQELTVIRLYSRPLLVGALGANTL